MSLATTKPCPPVLDGNNDTLIATNTDFGNFTLGGGNNDTVTATGIDNTQITVGDSNNDTATATGDGGNNQITLGNGNNDAASVNNTGGDTITLGNGYNDAVTLTGDSVTAHLGDGTNDKVTASGFAFWITLGDGKNDTVTAIGGEENLITLGNGNNDTVFSGATHFGNTVTVGNGNDTIHVGRNDHVLVGTGHDVLAFDWNPLSTVTPLNQGPDQSKPFGIDSVTITGFDPSKDVIVIQQALENTNPLSVTYGGGNAVITFSGETQDSITLVGVPSGALHASNFHFV
jgi:hypothetical protein